MRRSGSNYQSISNQGRHALKPRFLWTSGKRLADESEAKKRFRKNDAEKSSTLAGAESCNQTNPAQGRCGVSQDSPHRQRHYSLEQVYRNTDVWKGHCDHQEVKVCETA